MQHKLIAAALGAALTLAACGSGGGEGTQAGGGTESSPAAELPGGEVTYFGTEFAFEGPDEIAAGETTFTLQNQGDQPHMLVMVELLEGKTIEDVNTYIEEQGTKGKPPTWTKQVKVESFAKPGSSDSAKPVELTPGTYALLCFIPDKKTKKSHAELGMTRELTVK